MARGEVAVLQAEELGDLHPGTRPTELGVQIHAADLPVLHPQRALNIVKATVIARCCNGDSAGRRPTWRRRVCLRLPWVDQIGPRNGPNGEDRLVHILYLFVPGFILVGAAGVLCAQRIASDIAAVKAIEVEVRQGQLAHDVRGPG
jgi:hypothetical protein